MNMDEKDDFMYIELMDSIALDRALTTQYYDIIYETLLKQDRSISRCSTRIPKNKLVKESFKYEYYDDCDYNKVSGQLGLFGLDEIMAYIFVFDVYDSDSFDSVLSFAKSLQAIENSKEDSKKDSKEDSKDKKKRSLKYFIGNKYDFPIVEESIQINMGKDYIFVEDENNQENLYREYSSKLKSEFFGKHNVDIQDYLFFCSAKYGTNISSIFNKIYDQLLQNENLYKKDRYEDSLKEVNSDDESKEKKGKKKEASGGGFFSCCGCRDERSNDIKSNKKKIKNKETIEDSDDESYYDKNDKNIKAIDFKKNVQLRGELDTQRQVFDGYSEKDNKNNKQDNKESGCNII